MEEKNTAYISVLNISPGILRLKKDEVIRRMNLLEDHCEDVITEKGKFNSIFTMSKSAVNKRYGVEVKKK